jgi:beta-1,4-mannooligosaccharide phosphorylase
VNPMSLEIVETAPLLLRHPSNPILTRHDWPYRINSVFNAGATLLEDGTTLLLCRVEDRRGLSHLCAARSADGIGGWKIDPEPTLMAVPEKHPEEIWGIEDPRLTYVPELRQYAIAYTSYSRGGPGVSLALTKDFRTFERYGVVMSPDDKDAALLPHRIDGLWAMIHRPMTTLGAHIWISYSPDLRHWGGHRIMLEARRGAWWDANKIGISCPPIETLPRLAGSSTMAFDKRLPGHFTAWDWPFSISIILKSACCEATPGYLDRRLITRGAAMFTTSCFPVDTRWPKTGTLFACTMALPIPA